MMKKLKSCYTSLHCFLLEIDDGTNTCPKHFRNFFMSLSSNSPVCSYIHVNDHVSALLKDICSDVNIKQNPVKWKLLYEELPIIHQLLSLEMTTATVAFKALLSDLWNLAISPFELSTEMSTDESGCQEDDLAFFPSLAKYRNRGVYSADKSKSKNSCRKLYSGHPTLLPGIFTLYCPHGKIILGDFKD